MKRRLRRGLTATALASAAVAGAFAGPAAATITQSTITSPSSPFIYQFNLDTNPAPTVTITGTTNSTAPGTDTVDINCYYTSYDGSSELEHIATNVPTVADGSFTYTGTVDVHGDTCQLRAVPHGYSTSFPQSPFAPVSSQLDTLQTYPVNGGTSSFDYDYSATSSKAYDGYKSAGNAGLTDSFPINGFQVDDYDTWNGAGALHPNDGSGQRTEIVIDTKNAYNSYGAEQAYSDGGLGQNSGQATGFPALSSSYVKDPATGNVTIHESDGLVSCTDATYPATETKCGGTAGTSIGSWSSDGVSFSRVITETQGGQVVSMADTYASTDGHSHSLDLEYENRVGFDDGPAWKLPGSSGYQTYGTGDTSALSGNSQDVIYTKDYYDPDGSTYQGSGALIYSTQPNLASFRTSERMLLGYQRTVPAGGTVTLTHTFVTAADNARLQGLVNGIIDQTVKPTVAITSPANGSLTGQSSAQVSGTASAHDGLTLKVDGEAVGVNADGSWSTAISLHPGANTVTASASDGSGNTAQATETIAYIPPATPATPAPPNPTRSFCIVPNVGKLTLAKAESALKAANCKVGKITRVRAKGYKKGTVEHASASTGQVFVAGYSVGLTEVIGAPIKKKVVKHKAHKKSVRHGRRG